MRRTLIAAAVLAAAAGCGSPANTPGVASVEKTGAKPTASASATSTADAAERGRKFAQCMREHGVDMADPDPNQPDKIAVGKAKAGDMTKMQEAMQACKALSPFKDRGPLSAEDLDRMRAYAQCMRKNGVDVPDPDPSGNLVLKRDKGKGGVNPDDPAFKKAMEACRGQLPQRRQSQ